MEAWKRFEDLRVWQLARQICTLVWQLLRREEFLLDPGLRRQMLNSSGSIMDNIAEGFERGSNNEFRTFLGYAKGSAGELRSQLIRSHDRGMIPDPDFSNLSKLIIQESRQLKSLIICLNKNSRNKGFRM